MDARWHAPGGASQARQAGLVRYLWRGLAVNCCSDCHQGRKPCPTPDACELPTRSDDPLVDLAVVAVIVAITSVALLFL